MSEKLSKLSVRWTDQMALSRRRFFLRVGEAALGAAGVVAGLLAARSLGGSEALASGPPRGACYYISNGVTVCEQLSQVQCDFITGSSWYQGQSCSVPPSIRDSLR